MSDYVTRKELKAELDAFAMQIFKYLDQKFAEQNAIHAGHDQKIDRLTNAVDAYAKQVEIYHHESVARDTQVDRVQRWVEQVAQQTGVKLSY